jgi:hypothetical protein
MFANWFEEYRELSEKTLFISKLAAFSVAIFTLLSLYDIAHFLFNWHRFSDTRLLSTAVVFQLLILFIFLSRFVLLFVNSRRVFIYRLILLVAGLLLLAVYLYLSIPEPVPFTVYPIRPDTPFHHASPLFSTVGIWYLILSPLRQIITIITAFIKSR